MDYDSELLEKTRKAMERRIAEIPKTPIQYNVTFPVTQEQFERIIQLLEVK